MDHLQLLAYAEREEAREARQRRGHAYGRAASEVDTTVTTQEAVAGVLASTAKLSPKHNR